MLRVIRSRTFGGDIMKVYLYAEIQGKIDSRSLYLDVEPYDINVTDLDIKTILYAETSLEIALNVINIAVKYGKIEANIT